MHIKRFEAASMAEAVRQVKDELGPDALVLSTRRVRSDGGLFGLFGKLRIEVTAAVDRQVRRVGKGAQVGRSAGTGPDGTGPRRASDGEAHRLGLAATESLLQPLHAELRQLRGQVERLARFAEGEGAVRHESAELRRLLRDLAERGVAASAESSPLLAHLVGAGLAARHAGSLLREVGSADGPEAREAVRDLLARRIEARLVLPRSERDPRVSIFVGAPGVGKTTTLAKLAARENQRDGDVALVTTDTFRIGAEEQLRSYAELLQTPFATAASASELARSVSRARGHRVFIDTAGRGRRDLQALAELARVRSELGPRSRVHLVVSATTKEADLRDEVRRFAALRPDSLIVTKTDESDHLGDLVNLLLDEEAPPLLWMGTGQRVPEDLALPDPERLADGLLEVAA